MNNTAVISSGGLREKVKTERKQSALLEKHGFAITAMLLRDALLNKVELIKEEKSNGTDKKRLVLYSITTVSSARRSLFLTSNLPQRLAMMASRLCLLLCLQNRKQTEFHSLLMVQLKSM